MMIMRCTVAVTVALFSDCVVTLAAAMDDSHRRVLQLLPPPSADRGRVLDNLATFERRQEV